jgi:hypothetical protein
MGDKKGLSFGGNGPVRITDKYGPAIRGEPFAQFRDIGTHLPEIDLFLHIVRAVGEPVQSFDDGIHALNLGADSLVDPLDPLRWQLPALFLEHEQIFVQTVLFIDHG